MRLLNGLIRHLACFFIAQLAFGVTWVVVVFTLFSFGVLAEALVGFVAILVGIVVAVLAYRYALRAIVPRYNYLDDL